MIPVCPFTGNTWHRTGLVMGDWGMVEEACDAGVEGLVEVAKGTVLSTCAVEFVALMYVCVSARMLIWAVESEMISVCWAGLSDDPGHSNPVLM